MQAPFVGPTPAEHLAQLECAAESFAAAVAGGDLGAAVPACAPWDLRALAWHLGNVHRWARSALGALELPPEEGEGGPEAQGALSAWLREGAAALVEALRTCGPGAPCWTFGRKPRTAAFWFRRQAHETSMHAWDAARSQGVEPAWSLAVALDGIDEVVSMFFPRQVRLGRIPPLSASLALEPSDAPGARWVLAGDGTGPASEAGAAARATLRAPAGRILLRLWGRTALEGAGAAVAGDEGAARQVLGVALTP